MTKPADNPKIDYFKAKDGRLFRFRTSKDGKGDLYSKESPDKPWTRWADGPIGGRFERRFAKKGRLSPAKAEETELKGEAR
jgi:hypothetical protein